MLEEVKDQPVGESLMDYLQRCLTENAEEYRQAVTYMLARHVTLANIDEVLVQLYEAVLANQQLEAAQHCETLYRWVKHHVETVGGAMPESLYKLMVLRALKHYEEREAFAGNVLPMAEPPSGSLPN